MRKEERKKKKNVKKYWCGALNSRVCVAVIIHWQKQNESFRSVFATMQFPLFNYTFLARCSVLIARKRHFCTQFLRLSHIEILRAANQMHLHAFLFIVIIFLSSHSKFLCISVISVIQLILFASFVCIFYLNNAHLLRKYVREKKKWIN